MRKFAAIFEKNATRTRQSPANNNLSVQKYKYSTGTTVVVPLIFYDGDQVQIYFKYTAT